MQYFIVINDVQQGPFSIDELRQRNITSDTLVWAEGMPQWVPAWQVAELRPLFYADAQTAQSTAAQQTPPPPPYGIQNGAQSSNTTGDNYQGPGAEILRSRLLSRGKTTVRRCSPMWASHLPFCCCSWRLPIPLRMSTARSLKTISLLGLIGD